MDPNKTHISRIETLPQDLLGVIITKVGAASGVDFTNFIMSCKEIAASANNKCVYKTLALTPLVKKPLLAKEYNEIMEKCLASNNQEAHYIKGIVEYFHQNDSVIGLHHLSVAADAGHKESIYLYAIILLCKGETDKGKTYLNKLKWAEDTTMVDTCWEKIKTSLHGIRVSKKRIYFRSMRKMKPTKLCHLHDLSNTCAECFYFKQMVKFVFVM